jgi:outer membrane protein TolC
MASTFGSGAGALFSWEPFDFGQRKATVGLASALRDRARAGAAVTEFEVASNTAEAFLALLGAQEAVRAARANVERMQVFADTVGVLVKNELRPGADESRARAELARARTELIRAEQREDLARTSLAEWMGVPGEDVRIVPGSLLQMPTPADPQPPPAAAHPLAAAQASVVDATRAQQHLLDRSYFPRFDFHSGFFARGSGARLDGSFQGGVHGLAMNRPNWMVGMAMSFQLFDYASLRERKQIEAHNERAETARHEQVVQALTADERRARTLVSGAQRIAENTPVQLQAARDLESQANARYQAGLTTVLEVAEAQRLLTQAEIDDALARLDIWHALLAQARARGDMGELLDQGSR